MVIIYELIKDYRYVLASMQGWRCDMEDAHHVQISITNESPFNDWSFFSVFDGHAGSKIALHSSQNLLQTLLETQPFKQVWVLFYVYLGFKF